jgi:uncharacterized membrane protein SirB2
VIEFYPEVRWVHVTAVMASGGLFALRGVLALAGKAIANHLLVRWLSWSIDTVLLTAALMLMNMLRIHPGNQPWLAVKLSLLVLYIVLGSFALRRTATPRLRLVCFLAALAVYLQIVGIALAHDPQGWLAILLPLVQPQRC